MLGGPDISADEWETIREGLRDAEWCRLPDAENYHGNELYQCPSCGVIRAGGFDPPDHKADCSVAAALAIVDRVEREE